MQLHLGGTKVTQVQFESLKELYPKARLVEFYASAELQGLAAASPGWNLAEPGLLKGFNNYFFEIVHDGKVVDIGESGELLATTLYPNEAMHLVRYRTGDRARLIAHEEDGIIFRLEGREDGASVRIEGGEIRAEEIQRTLEEVFGSRLLSFEATIEEEGADAPRAKLSIRVMLLPGEKQNDLLVSEAIARQLRVNQNRVYADGVERGMYSPLSCSAETRAAMTWRKVGHLQDKRD